jgi:glycosyltransferase involved in cell wall biosynthesis
MRPSGGMAITGRTAHRNVRVLYFHQFFATRESSLGLIRSYEFSRRMLAEGHEVTVVTSASRLPEEYSARTFSHGIVDGIDVRSVRVAYSNYMSYPRRILSFLEFVLGASYAGMRANRPDVVFATSTPLTIGIPGWLTAKRHRVPFVFEVRDLWPEAAIQMGAVRRDGALGKAAKRLERFMYGHASQIIALSPGMAEGVIAEGVAPDRVHTIPNSADLDLFSPGPKDAELVERYGLGDAFVVGYAGAIGPSNAVEKQVPHAARELLARGREDIRFLICGEGKSLPELQRLVSEWDLSNVVLTGQAVAKRDIPRYTRTSDLLLTLFDDKPILATNSPNKFFDGLASGRPMLVNSPGWTRDLVQDNDCGVYVPPGDGVAMADAIERLADDPDARARMGANARSLAERRFARDLLAHELIGVLERAVREATDVTDPDTGARSS